MTLNNVQCINFPYNLDLATQAQSTLGHVLDFAPYNSSAQAEIENQNSRYRCKLEIASRFGKFTGIAQAGNPHSAIARARRRLVAELTHWRRQRVFVPALGG